MIAFTCPDCGQAMTCEDSRAGDDADCPSCGAPFIIPSVESEEEIEDLQHALSGPRPRYGARTGRSKREVKMSKKINETTPLTTFIAVVLLSGLGVWIYHGLMSAHQRDVTREAGNPERRSQADAYDVRRVDCVPFTVTSTRDVSWALAQRCTLKIRVGRELHTEAEVRQICLALLDSRPGLSDYDAVAFYFYLPDSKTDGAYTAARADWAPYGDWGRASSDMPKSNFAFEITLGSAFGELSEESIAADIPEATRREIFRAIEAAQRPIEDKEDRQAREKPFAQWENFGEEYAQANHQVARKYGISLDDLHKIMAEGVVLGWE